MTLSDVEKVEMSAVKQVTFDLLVKDIRIQTAKPLRPNNQNAFLCLSRTMNPYGKGIFFLNYSFLFVIPKYDTPISLEALKKNEMRNSEQGRRFMMGPRKTSDLQDFSS